MSSRPLGGHYVVALLQANWLYNQAMTENATLGELLEELRRLLPTIADNYKVDTLGVFGSYVREEENAQSDLDILVTFQQTPSLLKFIELENFLSDQLGVKVDLVMRDALKPTIGQRIMDQVVVI